MTLHQISPKLLPPAAADLVSGIRLKVNREKDDITNRPARSIYPHKKSVSTSGATAKRSYSRLRVSDDNAFAENLFRTVKYRPQFPGNDFADLESAHEWVAAFVRWYNHEHRHSGIAYVTPAQRHAGEDRAILAARHALYTQARAAHPARWSRHTRDWSVPGPVTLNPERDSVATACATSNDNQASAA